MNLSEALQLINVLIVPVLYQLHSIDKRLTKIETINEFLNPYKGK